MKKLKRTLADWQADPELSKLMKACPRGVSYNDIQTFDAGAHSLEKLYQEFPDGYIVFDDNNYDYVDVSIAMAIPESDELWVTRLEQHRRDVILKTERLKKATERKIRKAKTERELYLSLKKKFENS